MAVAAVSAPKVVPTNAPLAAENDLDRPNWLHPDIVSQRASDGRIAEQTIGTLPQGVIERGAPAYFRTYDQMKSSLYDLQAKYPDLVEVKVLGPTSEKAAGGADRDILALTLTNKKISGPKPIVEHLGGVHAREIANPELLLTWANQLLSGYGRDPEATSILDTCEVDIIPMVNPDGHAMIEKAFAGTKGGNLMQRKNTSPPSGTDINRNFDYHWGGPGASSSPGSDTYRGAKAASEAETQAVQKYTAQRKPSMFTDWHSYSQLNLYPWGDTRQPAPDHEGLKAVAEKWSTFNHYSPIQSIDLYPTTGTTDDWTYGAVKSPAWAVETGRSFHQDDKEFAQTLKENIPVLWYSAKIADDPFHKVKGPDATDILVQPGGRQIQATVSDATSGKNKIKAVEAVFDPMQAPGSGIQLQPVNGAFDDTSETATAELPPMTPDPNGKLIYIRAQDDKGNWGPASPQWLFTPGAREGAQNLPKVPAKIQR